MTPSTVILRNSPPSAHHSPGVRGRAVVASTAAEASAPTAPEFVIAAAPAAANDHTAATNPYAIHNPLWVIVIGMACFFGVTALIIALG